MLNESQNIQNSSFRYVSRLDKWKNRGLDNYGTVTSGNKDCCPFLV